MIKLNYIILIQIVLSLPVCFLLTKWTKILAEKSGFVNYPNPIVETHKAVKAYGGGIAISVTLIVFLILQSIYFPVALGFILILLPVILIGLLDDIFRFSPLIKIIFQLISVLPFLFFYIDSSIPFLLFFLLIIVLSQNAWNLIDIMDGLTAGISFIIFGSMGVILALNMELVFYSTLSFAIAFSVLGFRFLNKAPAKIFLGETGSFLLGSLFAFIVINVYLANDITAYFLLLLGSIPFFELFFLMIVRTKKGIPFYKGSPDHFALRMFNNGFSINVINRRVNLICAIHSIMIILASTMLDNYYALTVCFLISAVSAVIAFFYFQSLPAKAISK